MKPSGSHALVSPLLIAILLLAAMVRFYRLADLPPGLWFDEAWSSVAARNSAAQGVFPVYYAASFGGMHPAIVYLARLANIFSDNPLALRYAVAAVSTLTVGAAFFAFRAIFALEAGEWRLKTGDGHALSSDAFALFAALILAITYPFVHFSRLAFESSLPALAGLLIFGSLAVALRQERAGWFALTGGLLGLSLYSFDTARLFPFSLSLAYWGVVLVHRRGAWRRYLAWYGLLAATAVLVFLPLGFYFLTHWNVFTARAGVTTYNTLGPGAESVPLAIARNLGRTIGGLFLPGFGDVIARHNLPGRPVFDPFLALLFWLGLVRLAWQWKRPSAILLASWAGVMLLAVILTDGAPTYTRLFGALPALAAISALSWGFGAGFSDGVWRRARPVIFLLLFLSLMVTVRDYFGRWAALPQLFDDFQVAEWQAGQLALASLADGEVFLVPNQIDESHPTLDWLLRETAVRTFPPICLVYPAAGERPFTYLIHTPSAPEMVATLQTTFPSGQASNAVISPLTGQTLYQRFRQAPWSTPHHPLPAQATFGESIQLVDSAGISVAETAVSIPMTWSAAAHSSADHTLFIHLYRAGAENSPPLAQLDVQPCLPTSQWRPGDLIRENFTLSLSADLQPGEYTLGIGWYDWPTLTRLPVSNAGAVMPDDRYILQIISLP